MARRYNRIATHQPAAISFHGGKQKLVCVIRDISEGGVGLSVVSTEDIPDHFTLTIKGEKEERACTVRWRESNKLGASFDGKTHWMIAAGGLLVACAAMIIIMIFSLPVFAGERTVGLWFGAVPLTVMGGLMILFQRYRQNNRH
jgi:hypothetical protein